MEGLAGEGFDVFLQSLQMDFSASPSSSDISSSATHVSCHPALPHSQSHPSTRYKGHPPPSPTSSGSLAGSRSFRKPPRLVSDIGNVSDKPAQKGMHRRAHSEISYRLSDRLMFDELDTTDFSAVSDESGEDLLSSYLEMDCSTALQFSSASSGAAHMQATSFDNVLIGYDPASSMSDAKGELGLSSRAKPPRHHHSVSMDGSMTLADDWLVGDMDFLQAKKPVDADQLAEISNKDPRRAKRILANRQSAARSKERKLKYIAELEQKIQKLQSEATSLSAQLSILERDTKGLSTQNSELKLRLQAMEQQAQLRDALNATLKEEVQWLKSASVQMGSASGMDLQFRQAPLEPLFDFAPYLMSLQFQSSSPTINSSSDATAKDLPSFRPPTPPSDFDHHSHLG